MRDLSITHSLLAQITFVDEILDLPVVNLLITPINKKKQKQL